MDKTCFKPPYKNVSKDSLSVKVLSCPPTYILDCGGPGVPHHAAAEGAAQDGGQVRVDVHQVVPRQLAPAVHLHSVS